MKSCLNVFLVCFCLSVVSLASGCDSTAEPIAEAPPQPAVQEKEGGGSAIDKAKELFKKAEGKDAAEGMKKWIGDKLNKVSESDEAAGKVAEDTVEWASNMFNQLKENGLTNADNAKDWMAEDFASIGAWEYKVLKMEADQASSRLEVTMNKLGQERWECFAIQPAGTSMLYHFKRQKKSYLQSLPLKDMLHLLPLMSSGEDNN